MSITRKIAAGALTAVTIALGFPGAASAQTPCAQWDLTELWTAVQGRHRVIFELRQQGTRVRGGASYFVPRRALEFGPSAPIGGGSVSGSVRGNVVELRTSWGGVYIGNIDATGRIDGYTYDVRDSTSNASWFSARRMKCLVEAGSAPPRPSPPPRLPSPPEPLGQGSDVVPSSRGSAGASVFRSGSVSTPGAASVYCKPGFVWRVARPSDLVCVAPSSRERAAGENATAGERVVPGGAYGPNTCRPGHVWREAFLGDSVCVTPGVRDLVREENRLAATRAQ
jgi:hypothetical protein